MSTDFEDTLLDLKAVSARLGCSQANTYALIASKQLGAFRVGANGKGYRVSEAQLKAFLESRREHPGKNVAAFAETCRPVKLKHLR